MAKVLEYADFSRKFVGVINKAKEACTNRGQEETDHIVEANEMVVIGSGAEREMPSFNFWRRNQQGSEAEVDFVFNHNHKVIPVEVKSGLIGN